ncbi:MAG TPA: hypothetical protein PK760_01000, partial [Flavobacteriales bacterium]|nr:hypothetical protein [Flavobacteriales bacterium]
MIRSREDLHRYLEADRVGLRRAGASPQHYDEVWKFQRLLRRVEFFTNTNASALVRKYWSWR